MRLLPLLLLLAATTQAQWDLQTSHTTASLRGIHALGNGIAWASGTAGTILHTTDDGAHWLPCNTPPAAEALDFRGIQAFDQNTAIVMSSGKGDLSRLYKTTDACKTWKLLFTNPDKEGFWDAISMNAPSHDLLGKPLDFSNAWGSLLGDPVDGTFTLFSTRDGGDTWSRRIASKRGPKGEGCKIDTFAAKRDEAIFAASNESLLSLTGTYLLFVTGGSVTRLAYTDLFSLDGSFCHQFARLKGLPMAHGNASTGAFAFATLPGSPSQGNWPDKVMIVGGNYKQPNVTDRNAVFVTGMGTFIRSSVPKTPPHGYRSTVAYDPTHKLWITVGPNGTDISTDDGRNWRALKPLPTQPADADQNWNALSLPFIVGPKGRIGKFNPNSLSSPKKP